MDISYKSDNKRLAKNTLFLYFRTGIIMLISLYLSRVILEILGVEDYGIYNVVGSIVVLFSFLNNAMTQASQRFISFEIGKNDNGIARKIFNTALSSQLIFILIVFFLTESVGLWFLNEKLNIPQERVDAAFWVFQLSFLTFCINMIMVPYTALVVAYEKMSFFAYVSLFDAGLKLLLIHILRISPYDKLISYSFLVLFISIIVAIVNVLYCIKNFSICKIEFSWDKYLFKKMFSFSSWSLCGGISNIATQKGIIFLLNIFWGVTINAAMGICSQVSAAMNSFIGGFQTSFRPQLIKSYAQNDIKRFYSLISNTSKISFMLAFIPAIFLIINMPIVLELWLGDIPEYTISFCQLILACSIIDSLTGPYFVSIMATGEIKNYQIMISLSYLLDLLTSFFLIKLMISPHYIFYSRLATRGILNMFIGLYYMKKLFMFNLRKYFFSVLVPIFIILIITIPSSLYIYKTYSGICLLKYSLFLIPFILFCYYSILLNSSERNILKLGIKRFIFKNYENSKGK